jgi:sorbitol-specific phosphotransferase system component IIA
MKDPNEIRALKASLRGALDTAGALAALHERVEALDEHGDIASDDLEELGRITAAHAIASTALRGLVNTMQTRRSASTT